VAGESGASGIEESNETDFLRGVDDLRIDLGWTEEVDGRRVVCGFNGSFGDVGVGGIALIVGAGL
jgi:hypothetical protein